MSDIRPELELLAQKVESNEVIIYKDSPGFKIVGKDLVFPYLTISLCLRGSTRALYGMKEMTMRSVPRKNPAIQEGAEKRCIFR